jgi:GNAT superfamily N-acetyltransferase
VTIRVRLLTNHYLCYSANGLQCSGKVKRLSEEEWDLISCMEDEDSSHVATATDCGKLVGWFRMTRVGRNLYAQGTWVAPTHRRQGLAAQLWERALERLSPANIDVTVVSEGGVALIDHMEKAHPEIWWTVEGRRDVQ